MRHTIPTTLAALTLAATAATPAHATEPVQATPTGGTIHYAAMTHNESVTGPAYTTNGVPFAKADSGNIVVGDNDDPAWTRTWIPFTGDVITLAPNTSTVIDSTPVPGVPYVHGGIGNEYLTTGGEDRHGRPTTTEYTVHTGAHAGATQVTIQQFKTGTGKETEIQWTSAHGDHVVTAAIRGAYLAHGGARTQGAAVTGEYTTWVHGKKYTEQRFQRGTFRWAPDTGAFRAS